MAEPLEWTFQLYDKMSANADRMSKSLELLQRTLGSVKKESGAAQNSFGGFSGPLGTLVGGVKEAVSVLGELGASFAHAALDAIGFKESTTVALTAMTGSVGKADTIFKRAMTFGDLTPLSTRGSVAMFKQLMGGGFKGKDLEDTFASISDISAQSGGGEEEMQRVIMQLVEGKALGKFSLRHLQPIMMALGAAGGGGDVGASEALYAELAKKTGMDVAGVHTAVSNGTIDATATIEAIKDLVQKNIDHGNLGKASIEQSHTIPGLMSTLGSFSDKAFFGADLKSSGVENIKDSMEAMSKVIDRLTASGGPLQTLIQDIVNDFGAWMKQVGGVDELYKKAVQLVDVMRDFWTILKGVGGLLEKMAPLFNVLGIGVKGVAEMVDAAHGNNSTGDREKARLAAEGKTADLGRINEVAFAKSQREGGGVGGFFTYGAALIDGFANGVEKSAPVAVDATYQSMNAVAQSGADALQIKSPSRVFQRFGEMSMAGFAEGLDPDAAGELGKMLQPRGPALASISGGGRGLQMGDLNLHIQVEGAGADPEGIARKIADILPSELQTLFERIGLELGVA